MNEIYHVKCMVNVSNPFYKHEVIKQKRVLLIGVFRVMVKEAFNIFIL